LCRASEAVRTPAGGPWDPLNIRRGGGWEPLNTRRVPLGTLNTRRGALYPLNTCRGNHRGFIPMFAPRCLASEVRTPAGGAWEPSNTRRGGLYPLNTNRGNHRGFIPIVRSSLFSERGRSNTRRAPLGPFEHPQQPAGTVRTPVGPTTGGLFQLFAPRCSLIERLNVQFLCSERGSNTRRGNHMAYSNRPLLVSLLRRSSWVAQ